MILKNLTLRNWGVLREEETLEFDPGLNIIVGPNESGKSTVREALLRTFFAKHSVPSAALVFVPWGSVGLAPEVTAEFEVPDGTYRAHKRFVKDQDAVLSKQEDGGWIRVAEGDMADELLAGFLKGSLPSRQMPKVEKWMQDWGVVRSLWTPQGTIGELWDPGEAARERLLSEVGGVLTTEEEKRVMALLERELEATLTPERRGVKKGSELWEVESEVEKIRSSIEAVSETARKREELAKRLEDAGAQLEERERALEEARAELAESSEAAEEARTHERVRKEKVSEVAQLKRDWKDVEARVERLEQSQEREGELDGDISSVTSQIEVIEKELEVLASTLKEVEEQVGAEEEAVNQREAEVRDARIAFDVLSKRRDLMRMEQNLENVEGLVQDIEALEKALKASKEVTEGDIKEIRKKERDLDKLKGKLEAQGLALSITSHTKLKGAVKLDADEEGLSLSEGTSGTWRASRALSVTIPDLLDLEVTSGSEDVQKLTGKVMKLETDLRSSLAGFDVEDVEGLQRSHQERLHKEERLSQMEGKLAELAPDGVDALRESITESRSAISSSIEKISEGSTMRELAGSEKPEEDMEEASRRMDEAEKELEAEKESLTDLKALEKESRDEHGALTSRRAKVENRLIELETSQKFVHEALEEVRSDGLSDEERVSRKDKLAAELAIAQSALKGLESEIEEKEVRPLARFEAAGRALEEHRGELSSMKEERGRLQGALNELVEAGDYTELAKLEESFGELERRRRKLRIDADAVALLVDLLGHHQRRLVEAMAAPVRERVDDNFRRLVGPRYGGVEFDEALQLSKVKVEGVEECQSIDCLSHGTREQLGMLVRLALADVMAGEDRLPVILDDPLAHADSARRRVALEILQEATKNLQVIVLTCHPEDYAGLKDTNKIELGIG